LATGGDYIPRPVFHGGWPSIPPEHPATDPEARLARKGALAARPSSVLAGHVLMENRNGPVVDVEINSPSGNAERDRGGRSEAALDRGVLQPQTHHHHLVTVDQPGAKWRSPAARGEY